MTKEDEYKNALNAYMNLDVHINKSLRLIGISAIKKQIPKKPKESVLGIYCSECKHFVSGTEYYCEFCGQAIDWSDICE